MKSFDKFISALGELIDSFKQRRIKSVDTWDGAASNYPDTDSYCAACLIDLNSAAGREEKTKEYCFLPIREAGDSRETYVDKAVMAAAGGRGITRVEKPEDVSDDDWMSAKRQAANEIIKAYEEMDRVAPASVYQEAGKEAPEEARALGFGDFAEQVMEYVEEMGEMARLVDVFHEAGAMYAIVAQDGKLYRLDIGVNDMDEVEMSEPQQVKMEFSAVGRMMIKRQADGRYRWLATCCTAVLNRVAEIDTTALFDNFISRIERGDSDYPELDFFHLPNSDIGKCDYLARDGYVLIASGTFDNTPLGTQAAKAIERDGDYWGNSIAYLPLDYEIMTIEGAKIPAFTDGIIRKITVLPEGAAASLFTAMRTNKEVDNMRMEVKAAAQKLFGDALADELESVVDGVNRTIEDEQLIAREGEVTEEAQVDETQPVEATVKVEKAKNEVEAVTKMREQIGGLQGEIGALKAVVDELVKAIDGVSGRIESLEVSDEERKRAWLSDAVTMPAPPTHRPRLARAKQDEEPEKLDSGARVSELLKQKGFRA